MLGLLPVSACDFEAEVSNENTVRMKEIVLHKLEYIKDNKTGLCFGYVYVTTDKKAQSTGGPVIVNVPCEALTNVELVFPCK